MFTYKITTDKTAKIWKSEDQSEPPLLAQPSYPNGDSWTKAEAEAWAKSFCESRNNPETMLVPGPSRDQKLVPKTEQVPTDEELAEEAAEEEAAEEAPAE